MFNNRMLAVAAVLVMAVPALGAAAPIVVPPVPEQLVEGHTVFTIIEIANAAPPCPTPPCYDNTTVTNYAAAVAVLVREYDASGTAPYQSKSGSRFPGVLWFNDQYLVNPDQSVGNRPGTGGDDAYIRYPCGGAVMAVNRGDPDPRMHMIEPTLAQTVDPLDLLAQDAYAATYNGVAWVHEDGSTDTVFGAMIGQDYVESYLITDPNDHVWIIDKYDFYTRSEIAPAPDMEDPTATTLTTDTIIQTFPVWVVNIAGGPVFVPDNSNVECAPFLDTVQAVLDIPDGTVTCTDDGPLGEVRGTPNVQSTVTDDPCAGYREPSQNGYCYQGESTAINPDCEPARRYNALLYFNLRDLTIAGANKDHSSLTNPADTNGCHNSVIGDYDCPALDDNAEGNSHPFHPATHPMGDAEDCDPYFGGPNPSNHGGSTWADPVDGPYGWAPCDYAHATREIDVYFSGAGRPMAPLVRNFVVQDTPGSDAPFHAAAADAPDHHAP